MKAKKRLALLLAVLIILLIPFGGHSIWGRLGIWALELNTLSHHDDCSSAEFLGGFYSDGWYNSAYLLDGEKSCFTSRTLTTEGSYLGSVTQDALHGNRITTNYSETDDGTLIEFVSCNPELAQIEIKFKDHTVKLDIPECPAYAYTQAPVTGQFPVISYYDHEGKHIYDHDQYDRFLSYLPFYHSYTAGEVIYSAPNANIPAGTFTGGAIEAEEKLYTFALPGGDEYVVYDILPLHDSWPLFKSNDPTDPDLYPPSDTNPTYTIPGTEEALTCPGYRLTRCKLFDDKGDDANYRLLCMDESIWLEHLLPGGECEYIL